MKIRSKIKILTTALVLTLAGGASCDEGPWKLKAGFGFRNMTPLVVVGGISYQNADLRLQGLGSYFGERDFWCGLRGSLLWTFFKDSPFKISLGVGGGYEYAQAPNELHKAINEANNGLYLYPYNFVENLDVSGEIWTSIYGFYTQISIPFYKAMDHDSPKILWGAGYIVEF